jgi:2'-5' RNA ligase
MKFQVRITLPADLRAPIDAVREKWNPERAAGNPAHATIAYHDEAPDLERLAARLEQAAAQTAPFFLELGPPARFADPIGGAYLTLTDPTGAVRSLRQRLLAPPFAPRSRFGLHVTLLHPDQGERIEQAWPELARISHSGAFRVTALQLVGPRNETRLVVPLAEERSRAVPDSAPHGGTG